MISAASPRDWRSVPLSDLMSISHGFAFKGEHFSEHGRDAVATPGNFLESGGFRHGEEKQRYYTSGIPDAYRLEAGDLIVAMTEQAEGLLGSAAFVPGVGSWLHNQRIGRIQVKSDEVSLAYLYYVFNSFEFRKSVAETAAGTKVKHTSPGRLGAVEVLLPSRAEQDRIAGNLDDVNAMILGLESLAAKKQAIKQGMMQQLLTGKVRLSSCDDPWGEVHLREISESITKGATPTTYGFAWESSGIPFLRSECVSGRGLDMRHSMFISPAANHVLRRSRITDGDILMTITGNVGRVVRLTHTGEANINQHIARIRIRDERFDPGYIYHYLSQKSMREYYATIVTGQAYPQISLTQVRNTRIPAAPFDEQRAVAAALDDADGEVDVIHRRLAKAQHVKQGMMQQLLRGRTRFPVQEGAA